MQIRRCRTRSLLAASNASSKHTATAIATCSVATSAIAHATALAATTIAFYSVAKPTAEPPTPAILSKSGGAASRGTMCSGRRCYRVHQFWKFADAAQ